MLDGAIRDTPREPFPINEYLETFSKIAVKYKQVYGKTPVLIIDNADDLGEELFDYLREYANKGQATVVFVMRGFIPVRMGRKFI